MISYARALSLMLSHKKTPDIEHINIMDSIGRVIAEDLYAPFSLPSYPNSMMDGYALRSEETINASPENPISFVQADCIGAGERTDIIHFSAKSTIEIMTGAPIPDYFDSVIPVEKIQKYTDNGATNISISHPVIAGTNIRLQGEDIAHNDFLLPRGIVINPHQVMTLSGLGFKKIPVYKKLKIVVIATGKELAVDKTIDARFQLYDCNSPFLHASLASAYQSEINTEYLLSDTDEAFIALIQKQLNADNAPPIIISTGAVSAGKYDFIPRSLEKCGAQIIFHKVAIRPGKPILFAILPNGAFYFGLPGNPSAVAAGFRFFVNPLLRQCYGMSVEKPQFAKLEQKIVLDAPLCFFQKAFHYVDDQATARVTVLPGQASFMISPMLKANAWVMAENAPCSLEKDSLVPVYLMK